MTQRPNILLLHSDQHRYDCVNLAGSNPLPLRTPHLDQLAAQGTRFSNAFCPIPVCIPTRNSLIYGVWPTKHLAIANWGTEAPRPAREDLPAWPALLAGSGYRLSLVGKWEVHPTRGPLDYGFERHIPLDAYCDWREVQGLSRHLTEGGYLGCTDHEARPDQTQLAWGADQIIRLLHEDAGHQPFLIAWCTDEPHLPCQPPEPYASLYPPASIPPWPSFPDPLVGKPYIQAQQRRTWGLEGWTWEQWAPIVSRYLGVVRLLDDQIGRILTALDELGLAENTVVIYTTDHGDMGGGHGMIDKHYIMYDDVTHVPLIIRWPGYARASVTSDAFVSHSVDLAATICDIAGVPAPATFQGQSLLPLLAGDTSQARRDILSTYFGNQFGLYSQRMVRDKRWKYVYNATAEDELYDLANDPGELHNLALAPESAAELARLRRRLVEWMEEIDDPLLNHWIRDQLLEGRTR
ncbi:MAG: sulfatase-like hydrolase/transferase [Anaerolineae bacterium]